MWSSPRRRVVAGRVRRDLPAGLGLTVPPVEAATEVSYGAVRLEYGPAGGVRTGRPRSPASSGRKLRPAARTSFSPHSTGRPELTPPGHGAGSALFNGWIPWNAGRLSVLPEECRSHVGDGGAVRAGKVPSP